MANNPPSYSSTPIPMTTTPQFHASLWDAPLSSPGQYSLPPATTTPPPRTGTGTGTGTILSHPRISYFITRTNGLPVPLIPADELPHTIKLHRVPRVLTPDQTYGLLYCGSAPYTAQTFRLESRDTFVGGGGGGSGSLHGNGYGHAHAHGHMQMENSHTQSSPYSVVGAAATTHHVRGQNTPYHHHHQHQHQHQHLAPDVFARQNLPSRAEAASSWRRTSPPPPSPPPVARTTTKTTTTPTADSAQTLINAILRTESGAETAHRLNYHPPNAHTLNPPPPPPPSGIIPDPDKKEWCTHWILHGDCAFTQQGCRYKHEMPGREKLAEIGIKHVPRWWLERSAAVRFGVRGEGMGKGMGMGGKTGIVGELKKPEEWLRKGSESSVESEGSVITGGSEGAAVGAVCETVKEKQKKSGKNEEAGSQSSMEPPTRPSSHAEEETARKLSTESVDLIQFAPLLPIPSSSRQPPSTLPTEKSSIELPKGILKKPVIAVSNASLSKPATKTTRVFVPAGESPEKHIAEVKKREQKERASHSKTLRGPSPPSDEKAGKVVAVREIKEKDGRPTGLRASRWATPEKRESASPSRLEKHQRTKSGCRPRRPASSSPPSVKRAEKDVEKGA